MAMSMPEQTLADHLARAREAALTPRPRRCAQCGSEYPARGRSRYCTDSCKAKARWSREAARRDGEGRRSRPA